MSYRKLGMLVIAALALAAFGCGGGGDTGGQEKAVAGSTLSTADQAEARQIYADRCVLCHGATGKGNGPSAVALNPKPRDYTDATWQKSVTDEELEKIILEGGAAVGKSILMPGNPDLANKPAIVQGLREIVRSFQN